MNIPASLTARAQWVTWRLEKRDGDLTKVPYNPHTGRRASSAKPETWSDYETAVKACQARRHTGIGFVFTPDDPFVGIDLDDCISESGVTLPWAQSIIDTLQSYAEISPSGRGVKIWVEGEIPSSIKVAPFHSGGIEIYPHSRYFTVTGKRLDNAPDTIRYVNGELATLYAQVEEAQERRRKQAYLQKALDSELSTLRSTQEGGRNNQLYASARSLYRFVASGDMSESDLRSWLQDAAMATGLSSAEADRTIDSAFSGNTKPFVMPEPRATERDMLRPRIGLADRLTGLTVNKAGEVVTDPAAATRALQWAQDAEHTTDLGNARRMVRLFGPDLRYVHKWSTWLIWDGTRWVKDETGEVDRLARETVRQMYAEAAECEDSGTRKELARWATASESAGRLEAMIKLAKSEPGIAAHHTALDANPWLLNCRNGTIDLKSGTMRAHSRDDLITKRIEVDYDESAQAPLWEAFIKLITNGDEELASYMQRATGYTLTGDVSEQCLFFCYGTGSNGKSTFVETLSDLLGDYWQKAPTEMLMLQRNGGGIPNDIARLPGARMVVTSEIAQGRRLDESKVKDLTGGDTLVARFMREEFFEFRPVFKLWLYGNHKPVIRGTDHGIWRRIRLIPFTATIADSEKDPRFREKLRAAELPGILAWAVRGCMAWQDNALVTPDVVAQATERYRSDQDTIGAFLNECCVFQPKAEVQSTALYRVYQEWCSRNGEDPLSQKQLGSQLDDRGFASKRKNSGYYRIGIGLLAPDREGDDSGSEPSEPSEPKTDMNGAQKNLMGDVEKRFTTVHGSLSDWPKVRECCAQERWQAAYSAAHGDRDAIAYIEDAKVASLARLRGEAAA